MNAKQPPGPALAEGDFAKSIYSALEKAFEDAELPTTLSWDNIGHLPPERGASIQIAVEGVRFLSSWGGAGPRVEITWNGYKVMATPFIGEARRAPITRPETLVRVVMGAIRDAENKGEKQDSYRKIEQAAELQAEALFPGWRHKANCNAGRFEAPVTRGTSRKHITGEQFETRIEWVFHNGQIIVDRLDGDWFSAVNDVYVSRCLDAKSLRTQEASARARQANAT